MQVEYSSTDVNIYVNQYFADFLKNKFKNTQFFTLNTNSVKFVSFFDNTNIPIEFFKVVFKKFNCDIIFVVNLTTKEVTVYKKHNFTDEPSSKSLDLVIKKLFDKLSTTNVYKINNTFLALTKHFKPLC